VQTPILLSSPDTRSHKVGTPITLFVASLIAVLWVQRETLVSEPFMTAFLLLMTWGIGAWIVWWPFDVKVADVVEEVDGALRIRRGRVVETVPYSEVDRIEVFEIGRIYGGKLCFKKPNQFGRDIGFYLNDPHRTDMIRLDPVEHVEGQIRAAAERRTAHGKR
jgi:hypothetical protein